MTTSDIVTTFAFGFTLLLGALGAFVELRGRRLFYTRPEGEGDHRSFEDVRVSVQEVQTRTELLEAELLHHREDMVVRVIKPLEAITARLETMGHAQAEQSRILVQNAEQTRALNSALNDLRDEVRTQRRA